LPHFIPLWTLELNLSSNVMVDAVGSTVFQDLDAVHREFY
jgi:hypothetical protein